MYAFLPIAEELEKLPMRAVVAYAASTARRISAEFRGIVSDVLLEDALRAIDSVSTTHNLSEIDPASVIIVCERVVHAYRTASVGLKSDEKFKLLFSLVHAALAAVNTLAAADNPRNASHQMKRAAQSAQRAVRPLESATFEGTSVMIEAAIRDYEILLQKYGRQGEVVIGDPLDWSEEKGEEGRASN